MRFLCFDCWSQMKRLVAVVWSRSTSTEPGQNQHSKICDSLNILPCKNDLSPFTGIFHLKSFRGPKNLTWWAQIFARRMRGVSDTRAVDLAGKSDVSSRGAPSTFLTLTSKVLVMFIHSILLKLISLSFHIVNSVITVISLALMNFWTTTITSRFPLNRY